MVTAAPDAWDECGACGHDYDDHGDRDLNHGGCQWPGCDCRGFTEETS